MKAFIAAAIPLFALAAQASAPAASAQGDNHWDKSYTLTAQPTLTLATDDSNLNIKSCGSCQTIGIHVEATGRKLTDYVIQEDQTGNTVHFSLKQKAQHGVHFSIHWNDRSSVAVEVETPASLTLHAETADGNLNASGLNGAISLRSVDGRQTIAELSGALNVQSTDGNIELRDIAGTLDARTSDGNVSVSGKLDGLNVHTSDGKLTLELANGSTLKADSTLHSSDGSITVRLPKDLSANLDVSASDGKIDCNLPLTMSEFHSGDSSEHVVKGKLNAGGPLFTIHTSDGAVHLSSL